MNVVKLFMPSGRDSSAGRLDGSVFALRKGELWWRDRYDFLDSHGYRLRERLRPGWIPSWTINSRLRPEDCEDSVYNHYPQTTEASRTSDGSKVFLKRVGKGSQERSIAVFLSSEQDVKNHCIPIIDAFNDPTDPDTEILVMPLLRMFDSPPFYTVGEVVDFMRQTLEGIAFIHSRNVAHRDCSDLNIMLDGKPLYPNGFHSIHQTMKVSGNGVAKYYHRSAVPEVKYYFTDFGLSSHFDGPGEEHFVTGRVCQVNVPELSDIVPYNPFAVDIYLLGDVYKRHFLNKYVNMEFIRPLVDVMTQTDPKARPAINDATRTFEILVSQQSCRNLRWRLVHSGLGPFSRFILDLKCSSREGLFLTRTFLESYSSSIRNRKLVFRRNNTSPGQGQVNP